ncbi:MAG: hypothetical protein B7Z55_07300 [Planctomycetales bacterium 12-60-4]|nr:MAG: hypothetical protein B7Z55_07300 [Planctomycetales bacterium 12-60-4]
MTIVSESAVVKFAGSLEMPSPDPGRLVHATLEGRAQVTGPKGLVIDGKNLYFSEAARSLYSDNPVRFEYANNRGSADKLSIDLIPQEGEPGDERPHIFGVRNVRLSQNVKMELQLKQRNESLPLKVKCDGSFDFDVLQQRATYSENVVAFRQTGPTSFDWIECHRMIVQFESPDDNRPVRLTPSPGRPDQYQELDPRLRFRWLQADAAAKSPDEAQSPIVRLFSTERQLEARASTLVYDGKERQIRLSHADGVQILQSRNPVLNCPEVTLSLGDGDVLRSAICRGAGWLVHRDESSKSVLFAADWKTHLTYAPDSATGFDVVELKDTASFRQPGHESALGAESIRVWVKPAPQKDRPKDPSLGLKPDLRGFEVQKLEARTNVVLVTPKLEANTQFLEAWIDAQAAHAEPIARSTPPGGGGAIDGPGNQTLDSQPSDEPLSATAERIQIRLRPQTGRAPDPADVWAEGRVVLRQARPKSPQPLTIQAEQAHVENHGGRQQIVHLIGPPAHVRDESLHLQGQRLNLNRADNRFDVDGGGTLPLRARSRCLGTIACPLTV